MCHAYDVCGHLVTCVMDTSGTCGTLKLSILLVAYPTHGVPAAFAEPLCEVCPFWRACYSPCLSGI